MQIFPAKYFLLNPICSLEHTFMYACLVQSTKILWLNSSKEKSVEKYLEKLKRSVLITNDAELF